MLRILCILKGVGAWGGRVGGRAERTKYEAVDAVIAVTSVLHLLRPICNINRSVENKQNTGKERKVRSSYTDRHQHVSNTPTRRC